MMKTLEATYKIVTPMFLGGANQATAELRPSSFKGALRFWWRALNWGRVRAGARDDAEALQTLHAEEAALFGLAASGGAGGQGKMLMRIRDLSGMSSVDLNANQSYRPLEGHKYLLGMGLYHYQRGYERQAIPEGRFQVTVGFCKDASPKEVRQVGKALIMLGLLGGLGSRSRRGFGSIALQELTLTGCEKRPALPSVPGSVRDYVDVLRHLTAEAAADEPPFTAFSFDSSMGRTRSRMELSLTGKDAWKLLHVVGAEMQDYRSWRKQKDPDNGYTRGLFGAVPGDNDHDNCASVATKGKPVRQPRRAVFGMPHPHFFSSLGNATVNVHPMKKVVGSGGPQYVADHRDRRASPLLIHVHSFPDHTCAVVQTLLCAKFLADDMVVMMECRGNKQPRRDSFDWGIIESYLDRPGFSAKTRIRP